MSGLFGVVSNKDCTETLFYGTDYQSHLGTQKAGMAVLGRRLYRSIHDISTSQFKSKFIEELPQMKGTKGIGVISDFDPQPIIISSRFGNFAIVTTGRLQNKRRLVSEIMNRGGSLSEMSGGVINSTELVGKIIASKDDMVTGIKYLFSRVKGSVSLLILSKEGVYAVRDILGHSTLTIGKKGSDRAIASEVCAFHNLGYEIEKELQPGEIALLNNKIHYTIDKINGQGQIDTFLWIYTGYPASSYQGLSVEVVRERCGANLARMDKRERLKADFVTGIPDSGIAHALGYAEESGIPYRRPLVKYTPGYGRSYTPPTKKVRDWVAKMKLIPIPDIIRDKKIVICDDSIVRGTQLKNQGIEKLWKHGAKEIHARIACPPLMFPCPYCNSTQTKGELAARRAINKITGKKNVDITPYLNDKTPQYKKMVEHIRKELGVTSLKYQTMNDMVKAIDLPRKKLCLYCWIGE